MSQPSVWVRPHQLSKQCCTWVGLYSPLQTEFKPILFCRNCFLCHSVTLVTLKVERAVQGSLCHGLERNFWGCGRLKCSDFNPVSKNLHQLASSHRHTVSPKITQKGLSYSERDTCKTLSRDDHAAAAAATLVEALIGQVGIWESGVKSKPQWSFPPWTESDVIPQSWRVSLPMPPYRPPSLKTERARWVVLPLKYSVL